LRSAVALYQDPQTQRIDWKQVAEEVTNRTEGQCYRRWTKHLAITPSARNNIPWTPDEDQALQEAVEYCHKQKSFSQKNTKRRIDWSDVSARLNWSRSPLQCSARWNRVFVPKETGRVINAHWQPPEVATTTSSMAC
jgi:hypothetical protein